MVTPWVPDLTAGHNTVGHVGAGRPSGTDTTRLCRIRAARTAPIQPPASSTTTARSSRRSTASWPISDGTNLTTPIQMAQKYLDTYGRKGVTQGIILETDGHPQVGFNGGDQFNTNDAYTCKSAIAAATRAKADKTNSPTGSSSSPSATASTIRARSARPHEQHEPRTTATYNMYEGTDATGSQLVRHGGDDRSSADGHGSPSTSSTIRRPRSWPRSSPRPPTCCRTAGCT